MVITKDRYFYKKMWKLTVPIVIQNVITASMGFIDTLMVSALGEEKLAAISIANQPMSILFYLLFGINGTAMIFITQYWGKKDSEGIRKIISINIAISVFCVLVAIGIVYGFSRDIVRFYYSESTDFTGYGYMKIVILSFLFLGIDGAYTSALRGTERVRFVATNAILVCLINVVGNYLLIFGKFGCPRLGINGAGVATLIARAIGCVICVIYVKIKRKEWYCSRHQLLKQETGMLFSFLKYGIPIIMGDLQWAIMLNLQMLILAKKGTTAIAAITICSQIYAMLCIMPQSVANGASIAVGKVIGQEDYQKAKEYANSLQILFLLLGLCSSIFLYFTRYKIIGLYQLTSETEVLMGSLLTVLCVIIFMSSYTIPAFLGLLRGGGDTKVAMLIDMISVWLVAVPVAVIVSYVGGSVVWIFFCFKLDELVKFIVLPLRINCMNWMKKIVP